MHPALKALGLKIETPRGYGVSERQVGETFNLPKDQAKALSAVIFPKVRTLHHKYVTEGWSEATLRGQVTKMFKQVAKDEMGMDDAAAKELSGKAWGMIMRARGGSRGPLGPTESAKIFMREFSKARPRQSMTLTSERGLQGIDDPTALRLEKITAEYMLSNNAINRAVSRTVYGALQKLDVPEALGGKGNFANRQLRRKIMFENREIKRITDAMKTAGMTEEMQKAADLEKQLSKTLSPGNAAGRAMDTMNRAAIIGMLFLKPAYISANLLGQAMFMLADHSLNPASIYNSVHLQNEVLRGERNAFFRATPDAKADEFRSTYARQVRLGMGSEAGGLISSIKVKGSGGLLANAHTKMAKVFSSFLDTPWRDNAFFHEASRQGFNTADRIHELLNAGADTPLAAQRTDIFRRANRNLVDYSRMTETEINVVKRIVFFYPWMKGATIYGGRFAAEHPAQLLALSTQSEKTKEMTDKSLGMLPSFLQGVTKVGERNVPGLGLLPTVTNPQAISTLGTAGEALQMAKGLWTGRTKQSDLLANTLTPAASAILAATTHVDPFTGRKIKAENASALDIAANVLLKMPAPLRLLNQIQQADEIKKGNLDPSKFLEPMTKSEAFGRWLGPGFGAVAGHPLADFTLNTREARSRAASEARDLQSKADSKVALWKDYNQQVKLEAKRVGVPLSPLFTTSMALKAQREAAIAVWGSANGVSRPNSIQRLESDMSLLVRMKKIDEKQAKSILISMTRADQNTIDNFRRDLGEMYFGSTVLSAYRKALTDRGAKLPAF